MTPAWRPQGFGLFASWRLNWSTPELDFAALRIEPHPAREFGRQSQKRKCTPLRKARQFGQGCFA
jgi:hypothetical protein